MKGCTDVYVYLDALMVKGRDNGHILNKAVYLAIGINLDGAMIIG